jgi:hypothetical protein
MMKPSNLEQRNDIAKCLMLAVLALTAEIVH